MKRFATAINVFVLLLLRKDISLFLKYDHKEFCFEEGIYAKNTAFFKNLKKRDNLPDHILSQYKEMLIDFDNKPKL
ncbi:hypothetical protein FPZ43_11370 [Mucilaginibacter pallidiroseus]|uniref:Uncharacterized protein n=1 Tax=Mucilaginibacter pallidiroseus TaxID=2599295 RepID=A0A563UC51_9SPHI|nr:hypothetical protein [Mucilaginibacter pallidiroseus]TWR28863.1 hypothetical protein FPZ43_11370 [Mucilaginibacter pallidiroseus]